MPPFIPTPRSILIAGILLLVLLISCSPHPNTKYHPWATALRALDPADASTASNDITAVYLRKQDDVLQIRIDLLAFKNPNDVSLDVRIEDKSAPQEPPLVIHITPKIDFLRIIFDPLLASVIIDFPLSEVPSHPRVNVSTSEDKITGLTLDGSIPTGTAPLLLTFYDTFAGRFPAEALRSWDGAHSGPRGERHGLKHLLEAAEEHQVPVVLLDLKEAENLSALDAMGVLPQIKKLANSGLLILPENDGDNFGLPASPLSYNAGTSGFQFDFLEDATHLYHPLLSNNTYLPIASQTEITQPTPNGPPLDVRRVLLDIALNDNKKDVLVLGGNFANSTWGSPDMVGPTLAYFASRPYIHMLTTDDLMGFPAKSGKPELQSLPPDKTIAKLETHYKNLTQPVLDFVKNWRGSPLSSCATDLDKDNQPECVLADGEYLAILDPQGARLTYLFSVGQIGNPSYTQLIGPSWQVAVGLSNPSTWDFSAGEAADPGAYPGAFADEDDPFKPYEYTLNGSTLRFTAVDGTRAKTYNLNDAGIEIEYQTQKAVTTHIPLLVDPWVRFTPDWVKQYTQENTPARIHWGLENGPMISAQAEGAITMRAFNESLSLLANPEDPNFDYSPGHYIPFPMAILSIDIPETLNSESRLFLSAAFP